MAKTETAKNHSTNGTATKETVKATETKTTSVEKGTKNIVKRSVAELKSSEKGRIIFVINNAKTFASKQDNKGLEWLGEHKETSYIASRLYSVTRAKGKIELMDKNTPEYSKLLGLCKDSHTEMVASNYGTKTIELLTYVLKDICGGAKGFNPSALADLEW